MLESVLNKVAGLQTCNFVKKRFQCWCYLVKFAKERKDKTMTLDTQVNLAESDKGSFYNQKEWLAE